MVVIFVYVCVGFSVQTESDLGSPGGKARIIHKESDIITAFAINKVQLFYADVAEKLVTICILGLGNKTVSCHYCERLGISIVFSCFKGCITAVIYFPGLTRLF